MKRDWSLLPAAPWEVHDEGRDDPTICQITGENRCRPLVEGIPDSLIALRFAAIARNFLTAEAKRLGKNEAAVLASWESQAGAE